MKSLTRRDLLRGTAVATAGLIAAACQPKVVEKVVKETVVVEKEKVVEQTVVVKEAVEVEKEVTRVVEKQVVAEPGPKEPVTVRYLTWWAQYTTGVLPSILAAFKDKYPHITIKTEEVSWGDAPTKYQTTMAAGTCADVLYHKEMMSKFYTSGQILDITEYFLTDGYDYERDFFQTIGSDRWGGKMYGWPHMYEDIAVFYNKEIVKEYWGQDIWEAFPDGEWDWMDLIEIATACTQDTSGDGNTDIWGVYLGYTGLAGIVEQLPWTMGDSPFDYENMRYNLTSPTMSEALHLIHQLVKRDGVAISMPEVSEVRTASGAAAPFYAGRTAMRVRATPDVGRALASIEDRFEWDCIWLPNWQNNKGVTQAGGHSQNIWSKSKVPQEAYEWIKYMGTEPGIMPMMGPKMTMPCMRRQELIDAFNQGPPEHINVWIDSLTERGGYGDHFRHNGYEQCLREYSSTQELLYSFDYAEGEKQLEPMMQELEDKMNALVEYGDEKPYMGVQVPIK